jgi:hypothetical protein
MKVRVSITPSQGDAGTHCVGDWVGETVGLDVTQGRKILHMPGLELQLSSAFTITIFPALIFFHIGKDEAIPVTSHGGL